MMTAVEEIPKEANLGLASLLDHNLAEIKEAKKRGEENMWDYTKHYLQTINLAKRYFPKEKIQSYDRQFSNIIKGGYEK